MRQRSSLLSDGKNLTAHFLDQPGLIDLFVITMGEAAEHESQMDGFGRPRSDDDCSVAR